MQVDHESGQLKQLVDQLTDENERFRSQANQLQNEKNLQTAARLEETEKKATTNEEKFRKMKEVYAKLREEHIDVLKRLGTLQTEHEASTNQALDAEDKLRSLSRELESMRRDRSLVDEKAQNRAQQVDELNDQLARMQLEIETLNKVGDSFVEYNRESR